MKIIRTDRNSTVRVVARYSEITTQIAHDFMLTAAQAEAETRTDSVAVEIDGGPLSGRSRAKLIDCDGKVLATYSQEW